MSMRATLKDPKTALVLVVFGLPFLTGCLSTQSEQNNLVSKGFQSMIIPLVFGSGNPFVGGLLHGFTNDLMTPTERNKRQPVRQK
jgi:hypothetical protein